MAVIGRSLCLTLVCAAALLADAHDDIVDHFAAMAAALADNNAAGFMAGVEKTMPEYDRLKAQIEALVGLATVASDIDPQQDTGDDRQRSVDLDWFLSLRSKQPDGPTVQRRQVIHCDLRKEGKHWKIVAIAPLDFFAPPEFSK
jgi:hypothetical protein